MEAYISGCGSEPRELRQRHTLTHTPHLKLKLMNLHRGSLVLVLVVVVVLRFVDWVGGAHSFIKPQLVVAAVVLNVMDCWQRINWRGLCSRKRRRRVEARAAYAPHRSMCGYDLILDACTHTHIYLPTISLLFGARALTHMQERTHARMWCTLLAAPNNNYTVPFTRTRTICMAHKILESIIYSSHRISQLLVFFFVPVWARENG